MSNLETGITKRQTDRQRSRNIISCGIAALKPNRILKRNIEYKEKGESSQYITVLHTDIAHTLYETYSCLRKSTEEGNTIVTRCTETV